MPSGERQAWGQGRLSQLPVIVAKFLIPVTHLRYRPLMSKWVDMRKGAYCPSQVTVASGTQPQCQMCM